MTAVCYFGCQKNNCSNEVLTFACPAKNAGFLQSKVRSSSINISVFLDLQRSIAPPYRQEMITAVPSSESQVLSIQFSDEVPFSEGISENGMALDVLWPPSSSNSLDAMGMYWYKPSYRPTWGFAHLGCPTLKRQKLWESHLNMLI